MDETTVVGIGKSQKAAQKFIEILKEEIRNAVGKDFSGGQISADAAEELENIVFDKPVVIKTGGNRKVNKYSIGILFIGDPHRDSLDQNRYDGIDNIFYLLNDGYNARNTVRGVWKGHGNNEIESLQNREGAHFVESAIKRFMSECAAQYNVVGIDFTRD